MPSRSWDVAPEGVAAALLAADQGSVGHEPGADVLESNGHFGDGDAVGLGQFVQHHGCGDALDQRAPFAAFQQVEGQQRKDFQRADKPATLVHQADPVGVAVQRQPHGGGIRGAGEALAQLGQVRRDWLRLRHAGEGRVHLGAQLGDVSSAAANQPGDVAGAGPVHCVHGHGQAGVAYLHQIHQPGDGGQVRRGRVNVLHQPVGPGLGQGRDFGGAGRFDEQFQGIGGALGWRCRRRPT